MNKKLVIVFLVVLVGLILFNGCTDNNQKPKETQNNNKSDSNNICSEFSNTEIGAKNDCIKKMAVEKTDLSFCEESLEGDYALSGLSYKGECYRYYAINSGDPTLCSSLSNKFYPSSNNTEPIEVRTNDQKNLCIALFSENSENLEAMQQKYDEAIKQKSPELCSDLMPPRFQTACYLNLAKELKDSTLCEKTWDYVVYCEYPESSFCKNAKYIVEACKVKAS